MSFQGSKLSFPFRVDEQRGSLATVSDRVRIVEQSIVDFIETRKGERVMLPEYGISDYIFAVMDAGFAARLVFDIERVMDYEPLLESIEARAGLLLNDQFSPGFTEDQHHAAVSVNFMVSGSNSPLNLVFPTWQLRGDE